MYARNLSYKEIEKLKDKIAILPTGSLEQHGPNLPLGTDMIVPDAVADALEKTMSKDIVIFPSMPYGCSKEHLKFAGSTYFEFDTYYKMMGELLRSIFSVGFKKLYIIAGHGGNHLILQLVQINWNYDHQDQKVIYHFCFSPHIEEYGESLFGPLEDHAGSAETSVVYSISDQYIKTKDKKQTNPDYMKKFPESFSLYRTDEMCENGIINPTETIEISIEKGKKLFNEMVKESKEDIHKLIKE